MADNIGTDLGNGASTWLSDMQLVPGERSSTPPLLLAEVSLDELLRRALDVRGLRLATWRRTSRVAVSVVFTAGDGRFWHVDACVREPQMVPPEPLAQALCHQVAVEVDRWSERHDIHARAS